MQILDRRLNPSGRSLPNRQRFLRRAKTLVQEAVRDASAKRDIRSADAGGEVSIPLHGIREPSFHLGQGGTRDHVLPGNKEYREGDEIHARPVAAAAAARKVPRTAAARTPSASS